MQLVIVVAGLSDISQCSVTTTMMCGGILSVNVTKNFLLILTVKEFWKSVNIWWSYWHTKKNLCHFIGPPCRSADTATIRCEVAVVLLVAKVTSSSVKLWRELDHVMSGAQLPLYVMLHVTVMTPFSCTVPDADRLVIHSVSPASHCTQTVERNKLGYTLYNGCWKITTKVLPVSKHIRNSNRKTN